MSLFNPDLFRAPTLDEEEKILGFRPVTPKEEADVDDRLGTLVADPAFTENPDPEFQDHVRAQFRKVFPNPKSPTDEFGKMRRPRAATTRLDLFKPKPDPVNARPAASVGLGGANRPGDVWSFKKALSAATGAGLDLTRDRSGDFGTTLIDNLKGFQKAANLKVDGIANPGGPTAKALETKLAAHRSNVVAADTDRMPPKGETPDVQTAQKFKKPQQTPPRNMPKPKRADDEGVRIDSPVPRSDWHDQRPVPVKAPAVLARYRDGSLYLVMRHDRKAPLVGIGNHEAEVVTSRLDIDTFRKQDPLLPRFMTAKQQELAEKQGVAGNSVAGNVVVIEPDGKGGWKRSVLTDPKTRKPILVAGKNMHQLSRIEAEAMGLSAYITTPRQVSAAEEAMRLRGQSEEAVQRLLPELFKEIKKRHDTQRRRKKRKQ